PPPAPAYCAASAPAGRGPEKPEGARQPDVVIAGAGYTGLSPALHLTERGIHALVLEARDIGWGESSRSFGQVVPYLKHPPEHLARQLGPDVAERLVDATGRGPDPVVSLSDTHGVDRSALRPRPS